MASTAATATATTTAFVVPWSSLQVTMVASLRSVGAACVLAGVGVYLHRRGFVRGEGQRTFAVVCQQVLVPLFLCTTLISCDGDGSGGSSSSSYVEEDDGHEPRPELSSGCRDIVSDLGRIWVLLVWPVYVVAAAGAVAWITCRLVRPPPSQVKPLYACVMFGNANALPITMLTVVYAQQKSNAAAGGSSGGLGVVDPTLFLSIFLLLYPVLQWSIGGWLLAPPEDDDDVGDGLVVGHKHHDDEDPEFVEALEYVEAHYALDDAITKVATEETTTAATTLSTRTTASSLASSSSSAVGCVRRAAGHHHHEHEDDIDYHDVDVEDNEGTFGHKGHATTTTTTSSHLGHIQERSFGTSSVDQHDGDGRRNILRRLLYQWSSIGGWMLSSDHHHDDVGACSDDEELEFVEAHHSVATVGVTSLEAEVVVAPPSPSSAVSSVNSSNSYSTTTPRIRKYRRHLRESAGVESLPLANPGSSSQWKGRETGQGFHGTGVAGSRQDESVPLLLQQQQRDYQNVGYGHFDVTGPNDVPPIIPHHVAHSAGTTLVVSTMGSDGTDDFEDDPKRVGHHAHDVGQKPIPTPNNPYEDWWASTKKIASQIFQPPAIGALTGLVVAAIPRLRGLFVDMTHVQGGGAPLKWAFDALHTVGQSSIPMIMIVLGSNLSASQLVQDKTRLLDNRVVLAIIMAKMVVVPIVGFLSTIVLRHYVWDDTIPTEFAAGFYLVLMVVFICPTGNNVMLMVELSGSTVKEGVAQVIAYQYMVAPFLLSLTMAVAVGIATDWR